MVGAELDCEEFLISARDKRVREITHACNSSDARCEGSSENYFASVTCEFRACVS